MLFTVHDTRLSLVWAQLLRKWEAFGTSFYDQKQLAVTLKIQHKLCLNCMALPIVMKLT